MSKKYSAEQLLYRQLEASGYKFETEYRFHPDRKWRFDFALVDEMIAIEVEGGVWKGGRHTSPQGFMNDAEKYNEAAVMGWKVLRIPSQWVADEVVLDYLERLTG